MVTYSTWEYYSGDYGGKLSKEQYDRNSVKAMFEIDSRTYNKSRTAPESMSAALRDCECELADAVQNFIELYAMLPKGIASVSNDGISVSATTKNAADGQATTEEEEYRAICLRHLTRPVNLMYRGVS